MKHLHFQKLNSKSMANFTNTSPSTKCRKLNHQYQDCHNHHQHQPLIPGLPNHLAQICLSLVHPRFLYSVCRSWRCLIYSSSFPPFLSLYALLSSSTPQSNISIPTQINDSNITFQCFDPISNTWQALPSTPPTDPPLNLLLRHPSFISRKLPIQTVSVSGNLVLLAATSHNFNPALSRPLTFSPISHQWTFGPPFSTPRRWCATGSLRGSVFVASGIGSQFSKNVARSIEKWELKKPNLKKNNKINTEFKNWEWEKVSGLKDGRFSREAIEAVGWRGKLCMVNVKGDSAKQGIVYDMEKDKWEEMKEGMLEGWRGPVAAMDEEDLYVVDESRGVLRKYNEKRDCWDEIILEDERFKRAVQITAGGRRVIVVCDSVEEESEIVVVDVVARPPRLWVIHTPLGFQALAIHVLPRFSRRYLVDT